jgi:hypothetical protein
MRDENRELTLPVFVRVVSGHRPGVVRSQREFDSLKKLLSGGGVTSSGPGALRGETPVGGVTEARETCEASPTPPQKVSSNSR